MGRIIGIGSKENKITLESISKDLIKKNKELEKATKSNTDLKAINLELVAKNKELEEKVVELEKPVE